MGELPDRLAAEARATDKIRAQMRAEAEQRGAGNREVKYSPSSQFLAPPPEKQEEIPDNLPKMPHPSDFGLSEGDIARGDNVRNSVKGMEWALCAGIIFVIGSIEFSYGKPLPNIIFEFCLLAFFLPVPLLIYGASHLIKYLWISLVDPNVHVITKYREAIKSYEKLSIQHALRVTEKRELYLKEQEDIARRKEADYWYRLSGIEFERQIAELYKSFGYKVELTPITSDGGVDLIMNKDERRIIVQCKAHRKNIPIGVARELVASMQDFRAHEGIIVCLEGATKPVLNYIKDKSISVINMNNILEMSRRVTVSNAH